MASRPGGYVDRLRERLGGLSHARRFSRIRGNTPDPSTTRVATLALVSADFRTFTAAAPVDVLYCPRSWQCLDDGGRSDLPKRAFQWLAPGGACRVLTQNLRTEAGNELHDAFLSAGFFRRDESSHAYRSRLGANPSFSWDRHNELGHGDDARAKQRLASGEKMFDVYNASG